MFGLGNAEYVTEVLNKCNTEFKVIVYEPAASGVGQIDEDYAGLKGLSSAGVEIYVEGKEQENFTNFLYKFLDYSTIDGAIIFAHPMYMSLVDEYETFCNSIKSAENGIKASRLVKERFGEESFENMISNYRYLSGSKSLGSFMKKIDKDVPAIIVASGPSLSKNMHLLKQAKGKSVIISADSAVSALLANDIIPDFYISVDPHKEAKSFEDNRVKDIPAIVEVTSAKSAIIDGQVHFFTFNDGNTYLEEFINEENIDMHIIGVGGSVANTCFDAAIVMGFKTIIFVGLDLAYTGNKTHVENTARFGMEIDESTAEYVKDMYGELVKSSSEFNIYRSLIEDEITDNPHVNVIDATEGGALIKGTKIMTFGDAVNEYCDKEYSVRSAVSESDDLFSEEQKEKLEKYIDDIPSKIKSLSAELKRSLANYDEMYLMAKRRNLNKGRLTKILSDNDRLSDRINSNSVLCYIEYLSQDAIHTVQENAYKHNDDVFSEILEAATIGKTYDEGMLLGANKALDIIKKSR